MCLAIPGKIISIETQDESSFMGPFAMVDFQGSQTEVCLTMTPEARSGDWVLVHAGFALNLLDESEALETWKYLNRVDGALPEQAP